MTSGVRPFALAVICCLLVVSPAQAQRGPAPDPLVRENTTVKLADHTYVIPDGNVGLVPNVGIIVGSRATLVIDPGLGRRNGETVLREVAKVSKNAEVFIASTHFHAEHTTGYLAFPAAAKYINSNPTSLSTATTRSSLEASACASWWLARRIPAVIPDCS